MKKWLIAGFVVLWFCGPLFAAQSTILDVEGTACMGDDRSRKQTEQAAMTDAKRMAAERALTYLTSETQVKDFTVDKDLVNAYSRATVKIVEELEKAWYRDPNSGDCHRIRIRAEIIPDEKAMTAAAKTQGMADHPGAPLRVQLWTDKQQYREREKIKIYIKGNKPFYARVLYRDASGHLLQLLPNPYRNDNYFNGGVIYEIPSGDDRFELEVSPPFGEEQVLLYASTAPLGDISIAAEGEVYRVVSQSADVPRLTRGLKLQRKDDGQKDSPSEFSEESLSIRTGRP